jgi:uncharacterized protein (TIGR02271 family)
MAITVVGLYPTEVEVEHLTNDLTRNDFPRHSIHHHQEAGDSLKDWLVDQGVPESEAVEYVRGVSAGARLVTVEAPDDRADEAVQIMQRHERGSAWSATGNADAAAAGAGTTAGTAGTTGASTARTREAPPTEAGKTPRGERAADRHATDEQSIPVVEEELEVGKREVERGGVRVRRYVTEEPVEKHVRVRDETVHVDRRPADRTLRTDEADEAFREQTIEMTETTEDVNVTKRARVIEEVVLSKDVDERTEAVRDTVRRTDVDVERTDDAHGAHRADTRAGHRADTRAGAREHFDRDRDHYRVHHRDTFGEAPTYEDAEVAYRFGIDLAHHSDHSGQRWSEVQPFARERWERQNPGTWSEFEPAVRYGYERTSDPSRH